MMDNKDLLYVLPSAVISGFACVNKSVNTPLIESRNSMIKAYSDGLYHITSDSAADAIIASEELHASSRFASYGIHKRCFFFAGVPDFDNVCVNCAPDQTLTAIRVHLPYEKLAEFDERSMNDGAITYKGDLSLEGARIEKVRLGLKEHDGELCYTQISEEEYQNYKLNLSEDKMKKVQNNLAFKVRSMITGMRREFEMFKEVVKDDRGGLVFDTPSRRKERALKANGDLFEHTDEIPVQEINERLEQENIHEESIELYTKLTTPNNGMLTVGNVTSSDVNDIKGELLKGVISSVISNINKGIRPNLDAPNEVVPGMNDNQIKDVLYANICNGNIKDCYDMLNNPNVLFSVCKTYVQSKKEPELEDPRCEFFNNEINNYNSSLKSNIYSEMSM